MADNVTVDNGALTDYEVVTDEITSPYTGGTKQAQGVKLLSGTANANDVIPGDASNGLDVDVTRVQGTVAVTQSGTWDEVGINDSGNSITVDDGGLTISIDDGSGSITVDGSVTAIASGDHTVVGKAADGAAVSGNPVLIAGQDGTNAQSIKTDADGELQVDVLSVAGSVAVTNAGLTELAAAIDTELQVDVVAALPAGTNNIGDVDVASIAAGDNNIGNVDIVTVPADPFGANADAAVVAGATGSIQAKLRRISSDIDSIKTAVETLDNTVSGSELQVDVLTMPTVAVTQSGTWDEVGIHDSGNSITVDNGGTFVVQENGAALTALQLIDDTVYADDATFTPATSKVLGIGLQADEASTDSVDEGDIGAPRMTLDRKVIVNNQPHTAGGCDIFRSLDLDESEEDVKTSAGTVYGYYIANLATSTRFVKFYNATAANVTVGSTTPVMTLPIPGNSSDDVGANMLGGVGIKFDTAICVAATTGVADADTGAPSANDVVVNIYYK